MRTSLGSWLIAAFSVSLVSNAFAQTPLRIKTSYALGRTTAEALGRGFQEQHSAPVAWSWTGSAGAISGLYDGSADIAFSSRSLSSKELELASRLGLRIEELFVGSQATSLVVHPSNEIASLDFTEMTRIMSGALTNWSQLGRTSSRIRVSCPLTRTPLFAQIEASLIGMRNRALSDDIFYLRDPIEIMRRVGGDRGGIGFVPSTLVDDAVRVVPFTAPGGELLSVTGSSIHDRSYPLVHSLRAYHLSPSGNRVRRFLTYLKLQRGGEILREAGFVGLDDRGFPKRAAQSPVPHSPSAEPWVTRVLFGFRSGSLRGQARRDLRELFERSPGASFRVVGHVGENEREELDTGQLALERAQEVADYLNGLESTAKVVEVISAGNSEPTVEPGSPGAARANRRVDVWRLVR